MYSARYKCHLFQQAERLLHCVVQSVPDRRLAVLMPFMLTSCLLAGEKLEMEGGRSLWQLCIVLEQGLSDLESCPLLQVWPCL